MTHPSRRQNFFAAFVSFAAFIAAGCGSSASKITSPTSLTRCGVTLSGPSNLPATGGSGTVSVGAARECSWNASVDGAWLSIKTGTAGQGDGVVEFTAAANPDPATRRGAIVLNEQRVEITQAAGECVITLAEHAASFSPDGGSGRLDVRSSSGLCTWTATTNATWITLRSDANGKGTTSVLFDVASTTGPPRSGIISVAAQRFEVIQSQGCAYSIAPETFAAPAAGGNGTITITTTPGCPWTAGSSVSWLTLGQAEGVGPGSVPFSVAPTGSASRTGTAVIAGQTFTINQAVGCTFAVDPLTHSLAATGGTVSVSVNSAPGCGWEVFSSVPWIRVTGPSTFSGSGVATFSVDANTADARSQTVVVAGSTVAISQAAAAAPCSYTLSSSGQAVPAAGGTGVVNVATSGACSWTAVSNQPWLTVTAGASGTGTGAVSFAAAPETTGTPRTGTLSIAGQTFTVTQGAACAFSIAPEQQGVDAAGATMDVAVMAANGCAWTAAAAVPWLSIRPESGTGNGSVQITAAANTGAARSGIAIIAGRTFTVDQAAGCSYKVKPEALVIDEKERSRKIDVDTSTGCSWTALSSVPWIMIVTGESGTGSGEVWIRILENDGPERKGTLTIAGQTVSVTQQDRE